MTVTEEQMSLFAENQEKLARASVGSVAIIGRNELDQHIRFRRQLFGLEEQLTHFLAWAETTFAEDTERGLRNEACMVELFRREAQELVDAPADPLEVADVLFTCIALAMYQGINPVEATKTKLAELRQRVWSEPDEQGLRRRL